MGQESALGHYTVRDSPSPSEFGRGLNLSSFQNSTLAKWNRLASLFQPKRQEAIECVGTFLWSESTKWKETQERGFKVFPLKSNNYIVLCFVSAAQRSWEEPASPTCSFPKKTSSFRSSELTFHSFVASCVAPTHHSIFIITRVFKGRGKIVPGHSEVTYWIKPAFSFPVLELHTLVAGGHWKFSILEFTK